MVTDIATMPAGPEMNAAVAEMLGWEVGPRAHGFIPRFSSAEHKPFSGGPNWAMDALDAWREQDGNERWAEIFIGHPRGHGHPPEYAEYLVTLGWAAGQVEASAPTLALAICRALLLAGREVQE